jgi:hypothetical protein
MSRTRRRLLLLTTAALAGALLLAPAASAAHPPGVTGKSVTVAKAQDFAGGYDVAASSAGTAYIGWISSDQTHLRQVHLCTLPVTATACAGGVQTLSLPDLESSTTAGLRVLATRKGDVTLIWMHDTVTSGDGPENAAIEVATAPGGQHLSAGTNVSAGPSHGDLLDAEYGPRGAIWTVAYTGVGTNTIQVRTSLTASTYTKLHTPFSVGSAKLAFSKSKPVLVISKYGAVSTRAYYATTTKSGSWTSFHPVARTWTTANPTVVGTAHGVRLITGVNNASYRPVLAKWTGSSFGPRALTPDKNNCAPSSHDGTTDRSGRLLDASWECNKVTVTNYADAAHAAIVRFNTSGTPTYTPQIASGRYGIATVAWSKESPAGGSNLNVTRIRLPDNSRKVTKHVAGGTAGLVGPRSCLPPVNTAAKVGGRAATGWKVKSRTLKLGSTTISKLDGATLTPNTTYTLHGTVVFAQGSARSTAHLSLSFRTCAKS